MSRWKWKDQRLGSVGYNPNIRHLQAYNPFTNHSLTSWDILVIEKGIENLDVP